MDMEEKETKKIKFTKEDLIKEKSQQVTNIHCADRDGDLYYMSCPECKASDLNRRTFFLCKNCGCHFKVYLEDGHKKLLLRDYSHRTDKRLEIGSFDENSDYFQEWYLITPRIKAHNLPFKNKKTLFKDLQKDGKDGHGHAKYKRFALIPLN